MNKLKFGPVRENCANCDAVYTTELIMDKCPVCGYEQPSCRACESWGNAIPQCRHCKTGSLFIEEDLGDERRQV